MNNSWQLQEAKNKFSRLVENAVTNGPQFVTKHGKDSVVVLSIQDYQKITKPKSNLVMFFQNSPLTGLNLNIERDKSFSREIEL